MSTTPTPRRPPQPLVAGLGRLLVPPGRPDHPRVHPDRHRPAGAVHPPGVQPRPPGVLRQARVVRGRRSSSGAARGTGLRHPVLDWDDRLASSRAAVRVPAPPAGGHGVPPQRAARTRPGPSGPPSLAYLNRVQRPAQPGRVPAGAWTTSRVHDDPATSLARHRGRQSERRRRWCRTRPADAGAYPAETPEFFAEPAARARQRQARRRDRARSGPLLAARTGRRPRPRLRPQPPHRDARPRRARRWSEFLNDAPGRRQAERDAAARLPGVLEQRPGAARTAPGTTIFSVWFHVTDPTQMALVHAGVLVADRAVHRSGLFTRVTSVLTWLAVVGYIHRTQQVLFGMDTMMNILLFYLMIGNSGAALSVDRLIARYRAVRASLRRAGHDRRRRPGRSWPARRRRRRPGSRMRLIQVHFCFIYVAAGLAKLKGAAWWSGQRVLGRGGEPRVHPACSTSGTRTSLRADGEQSSRSTTS